MSAAPKILPSIRETRFETQSHKQLSLSLNGMPGQLRNISDSGVALYCGKPFEPGTQGTLLISINETHKLELSGQVIWNRTEGNSYLCGFHFNNQYLPEGFLQAFDEIALLKSELEQGFDSYLNIEPGFKTLTYEIKYYLESTKKRLDELEARIMVMSSGVKNSYREVLRSTLEPEFVEKLKGYSRQLDASFSKLADKERRHQHIKFFREQVGSYYASNPFIGRALRKPRGYAGDYEMMNQIYRDSFEGNSFFEMLMHRYGINESSSSSVKYRRGYFSEKIMQLSRTKTTFTFASVASGPAQEVIEFLSKVPREESEKFSIYLLDQDVEALLNAKRNCNEQILSRNLAAQVHFVPISVKQIIEKSMEVKDLAEIGFDLIYTAGLYDYLTQPVAQLLTQNLLSWLKKDSNMIIGNFHPSNPTKTISELVADWKLIHRTEEEMMGLLNNCEFQSVNLHKDPEGIDLFLEVDT